MVPQTSWAGGHWATEHPGLDRYLEDTEVVDWQTPAVHQKARDLTRSLESEEAQIGALFGFVRDGIGVGGEGGGGRPIPCRASHVLREGAGTGFAKCHLLAALLRARGIPVGFGYQRLRRDPPSEGHVLHGFVAVYRSGEDRWVPLDPAGGGMRPECDLDRPRLARTPDPELGEVTYGLLFARPHRAVLDVLSRAPDMERLHRALPDELPEVPALPGPA